MIGCSEHSAHRSPAGQALRVPAGPAPRRAATRSVRLVPRPVALLLWAAAWCGAASAQEAGQVQPPAVPDTGGLEDAAGQALDSVPAVAAPEAPAALQKLPGAPKAPKLPGPLGDALQPRAGAGKAAPAGTQTRREIDHRKKLVLLPRLGLAYAIQPKTLAGDDPAAQSLPAVTQTTLGVDLQVGIRRTWYLTAETQLLYILAGGYGFGEEGGDAVVRFGEGSLTSLTGLGFGRFTTFLDSYEVWTRAALKVGYLHPYYGALWLSGDLSRELARTPQQYWEVSVSPVLGVLMPLDARGAEIFQRVGFFGGLQVSAAFIFAPLGG